MSGLGKKILVGSFWVTLSTWSLRLIGLVSTIILARLLLPTDYGVVAMASLVVSFLQIMSDAGMEAYLIRIKHISKSHYNTAWTLNLIIRIFIGLCLFLAAGFLSIYFEDLRLEEVWRILAVSIMLGGFQNIGIAKLKKEFLYDKYFLYTFTTKIISFIATILLAYSLRNYWAMIYGTVIGVSAGVVLSYYFSNYRPWFSISGFREQWDFSKWIFLKNISGFVRQKSDQVIISKILGAESMGYYSMASDISNMPAELIYPAMGPIYAGYSNLLDKPEALNSAFVTVIGIIGVISFPLLGGLSFLADDIVLFMLGEKWNQVGGIMQIFCVLVLMQLFSFAASSFLTALGKVREIAILDWVYILILIPLLYYAALSKELSYLVMARAISYVFLSLIFFTTVRVVAKVSFLRLINVIARPFLAMLIMISGLDMLYEIFSNHGLVVSLVINVLVGGFIYVFVIMLLWVISGRKEGGERFILANLRLR